MSKIEYEEACDIYEIFEEGGEKMIKPLFYLYETEDEGDECPGRRACFGMAYRLSDFVSLWQNARDKTQYEMDESVAFDYLQREGIRLVSDSVQAAYSQNADYIRIPKVADFDDTANYYATLFHEMIHSTLHKKRLNREAGKTFGDDPYAKEELVAEIGAAILCNHVGIDPTKYLDNSAAYIKGWSSRFKEDKNLIITASKQAEKAAEYILYGKAKEETETGAKAA